MKRWVAPEKRSKKEQKELARKRRGSWGPLNPVTRRPPNPKAYDRKKARKEGQGETDFSV